MKKTKVGEGEVIAMTGAVRLNGVTVGWAREVGVGRFAAVLTDGTELGVHRTRVGAAQAVLAGAS